jgi:hypothetical protein
VAIEPEAKSWTWVNERPCPQCGFDASSTDPREIADLVRANVGDWRQLLSSPVELLLTRPDDSTWSALEYACHVRDVYELLGYRFDRLGTEQHPLFEDWHPDRVADARDYQAERHPGQVVDQLAENADRVIAHASTMTDDAWQRQGTRADGIVFTAGRLSTYLTHDVIHHVNDVEQGLARLPG